jgi:hypothetical protein
LAKYDEDAIWIDELKPFSGKKFFFEDELASMTGSKQQRKKRNKKTRIISSINNVKNHFEDRIGPRDWKFRGKFP